MQKSCSFNLYELSRRQISASFELCERERSTVYFMPGGRTFLRELFTQGVVREDRTFVCLIFSSLFVWLISFLVSLQVKVVLDSRTLADLI